MKTAVVTVGKEILTGHTVNTNLQTIAIALQSIGVDVTRSFVIDDIKTEYHAILDVIDEELIIFTGGLGPTVDDITRETVLAYFDVETRVDQDVLNTIQSYFDRIGVEMKSSNDKQALFPVDSVLLTNDLGTAPGVYFKAKGKRVVLFPGPPHEMKPQLDQVIALLQKELDTVLVSKGYRLVGTGESTMESMLVGFYEKHPEVNIAPYASVAEIKYIFTSSNETALNTCMSEFYQRFYPYIYGDLSDTLEGVVVDLLKRNNEVIGIAESCTGGMVASTIVNVPGSSSIFKEGLITYSNDAKISYLGVQPTTLDTEGAVSEACVVEMCEGLFERTDSTITVSISGIAGPTGGTKERPVGLVYFGIHYKGKTTTHKRIFNGDRHMIRYRAMMFALNQVRKELLNNESHHS